MTRLLEASDLCVTLDGVTILNEVSLSVRPGEFVALIGPNGAGKTTFLRCCAGLSRPSAGGVRVAGEAAGRLGAGRRPRLSYLPQGGGVNWDLPVRDLVALGRARFGTPRDSAIDAAMDSCRVAHLADRFASGLSGGETARVLLARALAVEAELLLADEPVASLDPAHQVEVMKVLSSEARKGRAVVAVLHDLGLAFTHASRIVLMSEGRIMADGDPAELLHSAILERAFGTSFVSASKDGATMLAARSLS